MVKLNRKLQKLLRDPNLFFEDYFANRRKRAIRSRQKIAIPSWAKRIKVLEQVVRKRFEPRAPLAIDDQMIVYESFAGKRMSCNPYAIFKYLLNDSRFAGYRHVWILERPEDYVVRYAGFPNVELVKRNSARHRHYLQVAKYLINNNTFPPSFSKKAGQVYVNTQHGVPIKTMGRDAKDAFGLGANVTRNFLHVDYLVMPNRYTTDAMLRSHDVETLFPGQIIETGYPRCDLIRQSDEFKRTLRARLGIPEDKQVMLYAPTYRGVFNSAVDRNDEHTAFVEGLQSRFGDDYAVIYKAHHVNKSLSSAVCQNADEIDPNELLSIVDVLITDYSSIAFDFFAQRKPILYFAYDMEEYERTRGMYLDLHTLPGAVCKDQESVFTLLEDLSDFVASRKAAYDQAIETYCKGEDGRVTERVVETIFLGRPCAETYRVPPAAKKKVLIYGGGFLSNGVTSSVSALMKSIERSKYEVYIAFNRDAAAENVARFRARSPADAKVLFYLKSGLAPDLDIDEHAKNEARRLFGDAKFDVVVDASGYGRLWPGVMAHVRADKRAIFLHSCMKSEQALRPHLADFDYLFELYARDYDHLICVSPSSYEANAEHLPHLKRKMTYIENIIDDARVRTLPIEPEVDSTKVNFINIGRYTHEKGLDRLIQAFAQVHKLHPQTRLYLVGYGPDQKALEGQARELGLTDKIHFTGKLENPFRLLRQCDCFVMSSRYEGQGIVLLEALVLGIPCISTNIPGPRSILNPEFLYEDSVGGLVRGMLDFLAGGVGKQSFDPDAYNARSKSKLNELLGGTEGYRHERHIQGPAS